ncbi:MAG: ATP-binding protein [Cetobacterium sp.]
MEKLNYRIEDSTIAELLGVQNFTNKESAILEIVKNSFDAGATQLNIKFLKDCIVLIDNGKGMNKEDITEKWMHVGKSSKEDEYSFNDTLGKERVYSGSKGIGRFALARLGRKVRVISKKLEDDTVIWSTDWNKSACKIEDNIKREMGTEITIFELRDKWNKGSIEKLKKYLSRTFKKFIMKIFVEFEGEITELGDFFSDAKFGINCVSIINFKYSAVDKKMECIVTSDEFKEEGKLYYEGEINYNKKIVDIFEEFKNDDSFDKDLSNNLEAIGDFQGELYFGISPTEIDMEKFIYKYKKLPEKYESGIVLYRNSFSISSYDGSKDWIGLGKRHRKSPAAATHPTGDWRVRENNIAGKIEIDKIANNMLRDLSNRQGLEENVYYEYFLRIIERAFECFEEYRQEIIRAINKKNTLEETSEEEILKKILTNPKNIDGLEENEKIKLVDEIFKLQQREKKYKNEREENEKNFKYDARILNVLSTLGLKATSIAHDMQNDRNSIDSVCEDLKEALIEHDVWDILDKEENKKIVAYNVPQMLIDNEKINRKISIFIGTLLQNVKKSQFKNDTLNILEVLSKIKKTWERDYGILEIDLIIDSNIEFKSSEDIFKVIFDNLILNSFQQNKIREKIKIEIKIEKVNNYLKLIYKDDGKGLSKKYEKDPRRILKVHETSRKDGHGLGMWITNNTIIKTSGKIVDILYKENNGFEMEFTLGSEE